MGALNTQTVAVPYVVDPQPGPAVKKSRSAAIMLLAVLLLASVFSPLLFNSTSDRGLAYGTACVATPSGEKPESKLWWNAGTWSAVLFSERSGGYHIFTLDQNHLEWNDTGTAVDDRPGSKSDVLWDSATNKLYVASHIFVDVGKPSSDSLQWGRLFRFTYDPAKRTYALDPGFPVQVTRGISETMVLAKDSKDRLWITYVENSKVMVNHTDGDDKVWGTPYVLPVSEQAVSLTTDDISSIIAFGGNKVGVMWSNQSTMKMYFAVHNDGDDPSRWSAEEVAYSESADDHINLKADSSGTVWAAIKTSFEKKNEPLVLLLARTPDGQWTNHTFGYVHDHHTRPIILIDEVARKLHMFATTGGAELAAEAGGSIYYKSASMDHVAFSPGLGTPFIENFANPLTNNATSTKQNIVPGMGVLVLASDKTTHRYVHNMIEPSGKLLRDK